MKRIIRILVVICLLMGVTGFSQVLSAADKPLLDYPKKGRILTIIVPYNPGGGADTDARIIAPLLEKKMGIPVQVINKPGAGTQVGMTELTGSKPDGYTILLGHFPGTICPYLDPTRQTTYKRKDIKAIAFLCSEPFTFVVLKDSPYREMKDVIDFAKANPEKYKVAVTGILLPPHLSILELEKQAKVRFATVHFDGTAPARTALLGGHTDGLVALVSEAAVATKGGLARIIGVMDTEEHYQLPDARTMIAQGYNVVMVNSEGILAPAATPPEIINYLEGCFKEVVSNELYISKMKQMGITIRFRNSIESEEFLTKLETQVAPLIEEVRKKQK